MTKLTSTRAAAAGLAMALIASPPAMAQTGPGGDNELFVQCVGATMHMTQRGLAFECQDERGVTDYIFVVSEAEFPGRVEMVAELLRETNARGSTQSGRSGSRLGLWVRHSAPAGQAQAICNLARPTSGNPQCRDAVDVLYR